INNTIRELKEKNIWVYAADMNGQSIYKTNLKGALAVVIGGEGNGVSKLTKELCDGVISLPIKGEVGSLNASVACGIVLYEALRQRDEK
ncbi:MAG: TrmH family RNA methyltransferase, partial [Clostridia bacterium]